MESVHRGVTALYVYEEEDKPVCVLPEELILIVFRHLTIQELAGLKLVCRHFRELTWDLGLLDSIASVQALKNIDLLRRYLLVDSQRGHVRFNEPFKMGVFLDSVGRIQAYCGLATGLYLRKEAEEQLELKYKNFGLERYGSTEFPTENELLSKWKALCFEWHFNGRGVLIFKKEELNEFSQNVLVHMSTFANKIWTGAAIIERGAVALALVACTQYSTLKLLDAASKEPDQPEPMLLN